MGPRPFYAVVGAPVVATRKLTDTLTELSTKFVGDFRKEYGVWAAEGEKVVGRIADQKLVEDFTSRRRRQHLRAGRQAARPARGPGRHMAPELQPGEAGRNHQGGEGRDRRSRRQRSQGGETAPRRLRARSRRPRAKLSTRWRRRPRRPRAHANRRRKPAAAKTKTETDAKTGTSTAA